MDVFIEWTSFLKDGAEELCHRDVLYMYASAQEPFYIGKAGWQTVSQRLKSHSGDGVLDWIQQVSSIHKIGIKVGYLNIPEGRYSGELLHDIESLLINREVGRGYCKCNVACSVNRNLYRPSMIVTNNGKFKPLRKRYIDDA